MVLELVSEIRSGTITVETGKKVAWVVGCVLEKVKPSQGPVISAAPGAVPPSDGDNLDEVFSSLDELKRVLDFSSAASPAARGAGPAEFTIPPVVWTLLIELIAKLLKK